MRERRTGRPAAMAAMRLAAEPNLSPLLPTDPSVRCHFLAHLIETSPVFRMGIVVTIDPADLDRIDWAEAATVLREEGVAINRARQIEDPFAGLPT